VYRFYNDLTITCLGFIYRTFSLETLKYIKIHFFIVISSSTLNEINVFFYYLKNLGLLV